MTAPTLSPEFVSAAIQAVAAQHKNELNIIANDPIKMEFFLRVLEHQAYRPPPLPPHAPQGPQPLFAPHAPSSATGQPASAAAPGGFFFGGINPFGASNNWSAPSPPQPPMHTPARIQLGNSGIWSGDYLTAAQWLARCGTAKEMPAKLVVKIISNKSRRSTTASYRKIPVAIGGQLAIGGQVPIGVQGWITDDQRLEPQIGKLKGRLMQ